MKNQKNLVEEKERRVRNYKIYRTVSVTIFGILLVASFILSKRIYPESLPKQAVCPIAVTLVFSFVESMIRYKFFPDMQNIRR